MTSWCLNQGTHIQRGKLYDAKDSIFYKFVGQISRIISMCFSVCAFIAWIYKWKCRRREVKADLPIYLYKSPVTLTGNNQNNKSLWLTLITKEQKLNGGAASCGQCAFPSLSAQSEARLTADKPAQCGGGRLSCLCSIAQEQWVKQ